MRELVVFPRTRVDEVNCIKYYHGWVADYYDDLYGRNDVIKAARDALPHPLSSEVSNMPTPISRAEADQLKPGDIYEDTAYHPCLCLAVENLEATGISLIDGSYPRAADIGLSDVRKLTLEEAWHWKMFGPRDAVVSPENRWWRNDGS